MNKKTGIIGAAAFFTLLALIFGIGSPFSYFSSDEEKEQVVQRQPSIRGQKTVRINVGDAPYRYRPSLSGTAVIKSDGCIRIISGDNPRGGRDRVVADNTWKCTTAQTQGLRRIARSSPIATPVWFDITTLNTLKRQVTLTLGVE